MTRRSVHWWTVLLAILLLPAMAQAHHHENHMEGMQAPAIKHNCAIPAPACSMTVTTAADQQGTLWRAFANHHTLYVQKQQADGQFGQALAVNRKPETILNNGEQRIRLAFGPKNQLYVVWVTPMTNHWTGAVRFSRSLDGGKHFSPPITVNVDQHKTLHGFPALTVNDKGTIFVTWIDGRNRVMNPDKKAEAQAALYMNWSTDEGASFQQKDVALYGHTCICCHIAMTVDSHGLPLIFFRAVYPGSERDHALVRFNALTDPLPAKRITFDHWKLHGCPEDGPAIVAHNGRIHFFWYDKGRVHYRQSVDGKLQPAKVAGKPGAKHVSMVIANGVLYRSWQRYSKAGMGVWLQTSTDKGAHWSAPAQIAVTQGGSDLPLLVSNGKHAWLSWLTRDDGYTLIALDAPKGDEK